MASRFIRAMLVGALAATAGLGLTGCIRSKVFDGPIAAVVDSKNTVVLVDLEKGKVVRTVQMRSWVGDIDADQETGTIVTSQSGGLEEETDDKLGIIDVRKNGSVRYVKLPRLNPNGVAVVGGGSVLVDHGWDEKGGMFVCLVDTKSRKVVQTGHVLDNNTSIRVVNGVGWASCARLDGVRELKKLDIHSLQTTIALSGSEFPIVKAATREGLVGWVISEVGKGKVARFNNKTGAVEASSVVDFDDGAGEMVVCRNRIVAVDFTGEDITRPGCRLMVFDPETLKLEREIRMVDGPSDVAVWRDRVVVANYLDQNLQIVDPKTGKTERTIELPKLVPLQLELAVLD